MALRKPVKLSTHAIKISLTPRLWISVSTDNQNFAPSLGEIHIPTNSLYPSILTPKAKYKDLFITPTIVSDFDDYTVQKDDRINRI